MSTEISRREFFEFLARPITRVAKRVAASELRARAVKTLTRTAGQAQCARCCASYDAGQGESLCPDCCTADVKNQELMRALFHSQ